MSSFRIIPQLEKYPRVVAFTQTFIGRICLVGICVFLMFLIADGFWFEIGTTALIAAIFNIKNRFIPLIGLALYLALLRPLLTIVELPKPKYFLLHIAQFHNFIFLKDFVRETNNSWALSSLISLLVICFSIGLCYLIIHSKFSVIRNWPLGTFFAINILLIILGKYLPIENQYTYLFWVALVLFNTTYVLNFCYVLLHYKKLKGRSWLYWLGPSVIFNFPFGKSNAFLEQRVAKNNYDLAVTQIKAFKLLVWLCLIKILLKLLSPIIGLSPQPSPYFYVSNISDHFRNFTNNTPSPTSVVWLSLLITYFYDLLLWAIKFNIPVVSLRLFGFYVPRGMYKPLYAKSIPDYFGRRYYYYKELIFDFFVFPLILRFRSIRSRQVRTFLAISIGVSFGTIITHAMASTAELYNIGAWEYLVRNTPFYLRCIGFGLLLGIYQFGNPLPVNGMKYERLRHVINVLIIIIIFSSAKAFTPMMQASNPADTLRFFLSLFKF